MRSRLLISISAAALIAGSGLAVAQDKGGPAGGPASSPSAAPQSTSPAQQSAPSSRPGGSDIQQRQEAPPARAQQDIKGDQKQQRGAQDQGTRPDNRAQDKSAPKADRNAAGAKSDRNKDAADTKSGRDATTGQGAAGSSGSANLTTEQRTKIKSSIQQTKVSKATNVNFNVSVGTVVPRSVTLHALPSAVVEVYPQWRGYRFVLVEDEIIIIEPSTYKIVAVIDA